MKRIKSIILTMLTVLLALPASAQTFDYEGLTYTILKKDVQTCKVLNGNRIEGDVVIPPTVSYENKDYTVIEIDSFAFNGCFNMISINIPNSVTSIGSGAFHGCSDLTTINIPVGVTSIESNTFAGCYGLKSINIPENVISIGEYAFRDCNCLTSINIPGGVTSIGDYAFNSCSSLTSINIPEGVTSIGDYAFYSCSSLTSITIPESVTSIGESAFSYCSSLTSIQISDGITSIGKELFSGCKELTSINIPDGVTSIGIYAFRDCSSLTSITIPKSVVSIGDYAFLDCNNNAEITYLVSSPITAPENIFNKDMYNNATLKMPYATFESVQSTVPWNKFLHIEAKDNMGLAVGEDFEFEGIWYTVIDNVANTCRTKSGDDGRYSMFDEYPDEGSSGWISAGNHYSGTLVIPDKVSDGVEEYEVVEIGFLSFFKNYRLVSVELPSSVTTIRVGAFCGCTSLSNISMQDNLEVESRAFEECEKLTSLIWKGDSRLQKRVVEGIGNPNLLVYVDDAKYAPEGIDHNIVADGVCENLVLTPGYPFTPIKAFAAEHSEITKEFTQLTPIDGCAGWETLTVPFEPTSITTTDGRVLVPFAKISDFNTECPFWLYEADAAGQWKSASAIRQGVPYLISMPNNEKYDEQYRIDGDVIFSTDEVTYITPEICTPYVTTWNSGQEFRSLWLPLTETEAANAMGLNVGINIEDEDNLLFSPGSAFHAYVTPRPLEAYVTRIGGRRFMPVRGDQSFVNMISGGDGLRIAVDLGKIIISSDSDHIVDVMTMDGVILRHVTVNAGENYVIDNLTRGIYMVAGRKIIVK